MTKALCIAYFGARGTGKTAGVRQLLERTMKPTRLAVWDFKHDPGLEGIGTPHRSLAGAVRAMAAPSFRVRYLVDHDKDVHVQFDQFCRACWMAGRLVMFVDELPEVTKANRAPPAWRKCVNVGRDYTGPDGKRAWLSIVGAGQRPTECDKSFIANCDVVHTGRLGFAEDAKDLARMWGCDPRELSTMPDLHWVEKHASKPELVRGVLSFGNGRAPAAKKTARAGKGP